MYLSTYTKYEVSMSVLAPGGLSTDNNDDDNNTDEDARHTTDKA